MTASSLPPVNEKKPSDQISFRQYVFLTHGNRCRISRFVFLLIFSTILETAHFLGITATRWTWSAWIQSQRSIANFPEMAHDKNSSSPSRAACVSSEAKLILSCVCHCLSLTIVNLSQKDPNVSAIAIYETMELEAILRRFVRYESESSIRNTCIKTISGGTETSCQQKFD